MRLKAQELPVVDILAKVPSPRVGQATKRDVPWAERVEIGQELGSNDRKIAQGRSILGKAKWKTCKVLKKEGVRSTTRARIFRCSECCRAVE